MSSKRQQTMAKMARERTVRERRERKLEKKQAAAAERKAAASGVMSPESVLPSESEASVAGEVAQADPGELEPAEATA